MAKTALITGASKGIGRAIAGRLASMGYHLFLLGRDRQALQQIAAQCQAHNVKAAYLAGNLLEEQYMREAVATAVERLGNIDVFINNAGSANREAVQSADLDQWQEVMQLNFTAMMFLCRQILPAMIERQSGTIINISSISGRNVHADGAIYAASKHAVNGFSGCMFEDVREYGIKVSTIMPGFVETALTAALGLNAAHMIQPDDIADAVQYIVNASDTCCPTEIVIRPQRPP